MESAKLAKIIKEGMKSGKYLIGSKEVLDGIKGMKLVILTSSTPPRIQERIKSEAEKHRVAVLNLGISSVELAKIAGKPFRVSAIALRNVQDSELRSVVKQ